MLHGDNPVPVPVVPDNKPLAAIYQFGSPTKFEFVINLKAEKALGLEMLPARLAFADEVIWALRVHFTRLFLPLLNKTGECEALLPEAATSVPTQAPGLSGPAKARPRVHETS